MGKSLILFSLKGFLTTFRHIREFPSGPGQLYLYSEQSSKLLHHLAARGQLLKTTHINLAICKRLSRSEGDLCCALNSFHMCTPDSPLCFRSQTGSEDSGVRVSIASDESDFQLKSKVSRISAKNWINFARYSFRYRILAAPTVLECR